MPPGGPGAGGTQWRQQRGGVNFEDLNMGGDLNDLLGGLFGGGRGRGSRFNRAPTPTRGEDAQAEVEITLEEAFHGAVRTLSLLVHDACPSCAGNGIVNNAPCSTCGGAGVVERPKTLEVTIPKGVQDGGKIRLSGQGSPGVFGGPAGDLYLIVRLQPHARFERKGDDLSLEVPVTFPEAALGAEIEVPTLHGPVHARVPAGTSSGQRLRLRGKRNAEAAQRGARRPVLSHSHYYTNAVKRARTPAHRGATGIAG